MAVQKNKKTTSGNVSAAALQEQKKFRRGAVLLVISVILLTALIVAGWLFKKYMFAQNKRLTLQVVEISSNGYWDKNAENSTALIRKLHLNLGSDNITALDLDKLRGDLQGLHNVANAQLSLRYPDTLVIKLEERVPRAFLSKVGSMLVVDEHAVVMDSRQCFGVHPHLPVIMLRQYDLNHAKPGLELPAVAEALKLIMAVQDHPRFTVSKVSIAQQGKLTSTLTYRRNGSSDLMYYVTLPVGDYAKLLDITGSAIENALRQNNTLNTLDLTFDDMVVFKP